MIDYVLFKCADVDYFKFLIEALFCLMLVGY